MLILSILSFGQHNNEFEIEGKVLDVKTKENIPYATVINRRTKAGKICNIDGYFRISAKVGDSISVNYTGYNRYVLIVETGKMYYSILLQEKLQLISDMIVLGSTNEYLFVLLDKCKKKPTKQYKIGKAYFELKSSIDSNQIELVESFYNLKVSQYDLLDLQLKTGRLALKLSQNGLYMSQGTTASILLMELMQYNTFFPSSPINLGLKDMRQRFILELNAKYLENKDSIYVIEYRPKMKFLDEFSGTIWINKTTLAIQKITMKCFECSKHPFIPLFPTDSISNVDLEITKTFELIQKKPTFKQVDFTFSIDYFSRNNISENTLTEQNHEAIFNVQTKAILYAYDFGKSFYIPNFKLYTNNDYRKIDAIPYNDFFWKNNNEFRTNDEDNSNENFFAEADTLNSNALFQLQLNDNQKKYFQSSFVDWSSTNRVLLWDLAIESTPKKTRTNLKFFAYNLGVKLFVDFNEYEDSLHILSKTIFDPFESYYYLSADSLTDCFINLFFDFCEIERQSIHKELIRLGKNKNQISMNLPVYLENFERKKNVFLKEIERGHDKAALKKWNDYVLKHLDIDNMYLFNLAEKTILE